MRKLLVCDLDGTLLGEPEPLDHLLSLFELPGAPVLAFATGRQHESAVGALAEWGICAGGYLLAGVGSEAYRREAHGGWALMEGWPPAVDGWDALRVRHELQTLSALAPQPVWSPHKVSFLAPREMLGETRATLRRAQINATLVHSHGDLLDVMPAGVHKGSAVRWLAQRLGIRLASTMTCGDSENDLAMLALPGPSVIVGGADVRLIQCVSELPRAYIARDRCAAGIVEGLIQVGWLRGDAWAP